jgi:rhamnulokinase
MVASSRHTCDELGRRVNSTAGTPRFPSDQRASIAVDLGAESCRVSLLRWIEGAPNIQLVHRFPNAPIQQDGGLRWPVAKIEAGVDEGMQKCAAIASEGVRSVAIDGWAVDYVRVDDRGKPLAPPFCYRDERNRAAEQHLHEQISPARLSELTGVQQLHINTLYQLHADRMQDLPTGRGWLNLPEYMLTRWGGEPVAEYTNATHTQLVDLHSRDWCEEVFAAAGLDLLHAPRIVPPGTPLGRLQGPLSDLTAFRNAELIAPACHDTSSAIAGIPAAGEDWAYISSGTWSLVGALIRQPLNNVAVRADNFTNLGAVGGQICFHKNVNGMWLVKQCIDAWSQAGADWKIDELLHAAARHQAPPGLLDVDDPDLLLVGEMPRRINAQRERLGLKPLDESPANAAEFTVLIMHSLAARYAQVLKQVQAHTGRDLQRIFIVGGGSRNTLLNSLTARATGLRVICGPPESSTIGNFAVQLARLETGEPAMSEAFGHEVTQWARTLHPIA